MRQACHQVRQEFENRTAAMHEDLVRSRGLDELARHLEHNAQCAEPRDPGEIAAMLARPPVLEPCPEVAKLLAHTQNGCDGAAIVRSQLDALGLLSKKKKPLYVKSGYEPRKRAKKSKNGGGQ